MPTPAQRACSLPEYVDLRTVERRTKIPYSTLRQWIYEGRLPAFKTANGHNVRVLVSDVRDLFTPVAGAR